MTLSFRLLSLLPKTYHVCVQASLLHLIPFIPFRREIGVRFY